jgi:small ubiquitin-related modifier
MSFEDSFVLTLKSTRSNNSINVKITAPHKERVFFRLDRSLPLSGMFQRYHECQGIAEECITFSYKGYKIGPDDTPASLNMKNNGRIKATLPDKNQNEFCDSYF